MQFLTDGIKFRWRDILLRKTLDELLEFRIHVVRVDLSDVYFRQVRIDVKRNVRRPAWANRPLGRQLLVSHCQYAIDPFVENHRDERVLRLFVLESIDGLLPDESLNLRRRKIIIQPLEEFGELAAFSHVIRQFLEILYARAVKKHLDLPVCGIHPGEILFQLIDVKRKRTIPRIQRNRIFDVLLHRVRLAVVANRTKRLIRTKQPVRPRKGLYQVLAVAHLVEIQRIEPFRVKAREHLINDN